MGTDNVDQAMWVVRRYEEEGIPFVLVLKSFKVTGVVAESVYENGPFSLDSYLWNNIEHGVGVIGVGAPTVSDLLLDGRMRPSPKLNVPDEDWQSVVRDLAMRAGAIVLQLGIESGGIVWELDLVRELQRQRDSVLVMEGSLGGYKIKDFANVAGFNRVVFQQDLPHLSIFDHPVFVDVLFGLYTRALGSEAAQYLPADFLAQEAQRPLYCGFMQRLFPWAYAHEQGGLPQEALVHYQSIINVGAELAAAGIGLFQPEPILLARAALGCARTMATLGGREAMALERLELARVLLADLGDGDADGIDDEHARTIEIVLRALHAIE